jgi:hypothetical protein
MGPVGAQFSEFLDRAIVVSCWPQCFLLWVAPINSIPDFLLTSTYKSISRYSTFWALAPLSFIFSKNDPPIYWHWGLYRPLISEIDPQFYCQGGHWPPFVIFWNKHCLWKEKKIFAAYDGIQSYSPFHRL